MSEHSSKQLFSEVTGSSTGSIKVVELSSYGNPKIYYHIQSKKLGCEVEMSKEKILLSECINARQFCDGIMQRYIVMLDNATFMPSEHS